MVESLSPVETPMHVLITRNFSDIEVTKNERRPDLVTSYAELTPWLAANGSRMCYTALQPARDVLGKIRVLGFYRDKVLNDAVNGTKNSMHQLALAVDFLPMDTDQDTAWKLMRDGIKGMTFDHLNYYDELKVPTFHVDHRPIETGAPRMKLYVRWKQIGVLPSPETLET